MTTARQLGEMLVTGKPMQFRTFEAFEGEWSDYEGGIPNTFDLFNMEYRIKPQVTYYRVNKNIMGGASLKSQNRPFKDKSELHIHDFQIEEKS